ncbi:hypothetical protein FXO37_15420 [Capsicum annuum]|nr:hypothetical protein FXO37_15420 [Capsicum annuum]
MSFFLTLRSLQTLLEPKVINRMKKKLVGETTITIKILLEGGLIVVDGATGDGAVGSGNGDGADVGANDASLVVFETQTSMIMIILVLLILVNVIVEDTAKQHTITVDNPSTASKEEEKVKFVSPKERKNYLFEEFQISDEALTKLINTYSEWIANEILKLHSYKYINHV